MRKRYISLVIAIILTAFNAVSAKAIDNKPLYQFPFEYEIDKVILPVSINGSKPIRCILDTGMPEGVFMMNPATAKNLNLKYAATNVMVRGIGSKTSSASMAMGANVKLGEIGFENQRVIVLNEPGSLARLGIDGVIGASVFNKFVVQMDIEKKMLYLFAPDRFDSSNAGESFDLTITRTKPYIKTTVSVDGQEDSPVTLVVDSGASSALVLVEGDEKMIKAPSRFIEGIVGRGVGGAATGKIARVSKLQLGKYSLKQVVARFGTQPLPGNADGLIGMRILERFLVTFDYPGKRMLLKPRKSLSDEFEFSLTGISVSPGEKEGLIIDHVFKDSPAAQSGILKGDTLISVNGKRLSFREFSKLSRSLVTPGKEISIEVERNGKRHKKTFKLKRLI